MRTETKADIYREERDRTRMRKRHRGGKKRETKTEKDTKR